jgi:hypothetical protein
MRTDGQTDWASNSLQMNGSMCGRDNGSILETRRARARERQRHISTSLCRRFLLTGRWTSIAKSDHLNYLNVQTLENLRAKTTYFLLLVTCPSLFTNYLYARVHTDLQATGDICRSIRALLKPFLAWQLTVQCWQFSSHLAENTTSHLNDQPSTV